MGAAALDGWIPWWRAEGDCSVILQSLGVKLDRGMAGSGDANGREACGAMQSNLSLLGLPVFHRPCFELKDVSVSTSASGTTKAPALPSARRLFR
jgi:hypothetical protein